MYPCGVNFLGIFLMIVPATILLTVSFFVLFTLDKVSNKSLKNFGAVVLCLLWLGALASFSAGVSFLAKGKSIGMPCPIMEKMMGRMSAMKMHREGSNKMAGNAPILNTINTQENVTMPGMMNK